MAERNSVNRTRVKLTPCDFANIVKRGERRVFRTSTGTKDKYELRVLDQDMAKIE
jgi:hypothetical protein